MNYFEFYDLEPSLFPDSQLIRQKFLSNQRNWHPDFFVSEPDKYELALKQTAANNEAHKALLSLDLRLKHIFEIFGIQVDRNVLGPEHLMELMDIQDAIADISESSETEKSKLRAELDLMIEATSADIQAFASRNPVLKALSDTHWLELLVMYQKRNYINRLLKNLEGVREL